MRQLRHVVSSIAVVLVLLVGGVDAHEGNTHEGFIHACVAANGTLRIAGRTGSCKGGEQALHWVAVPPPAVVDLGHSVYDSVTGLQWEKKTEGLPWQRIRHEFGMFDQGTSDGVDSFVGPSLHDVNITMNWCAATSRCEPPDHGWLARLNNQNYLGHSDWRMPTRAELASVMRINDLYVPRPEMGEHAPPMVIECEFLVWNCFGPLFERTALQYYWTDEEEGGLAYASLGGKSVLLPKTTLLPARAVRGGR